MKAILAYQHILLKRSRARDIKAIPDRCRKMWYRVKGVGQQPLRHPHQHRQGSLGECGSLIEGSTHIPTMNYQFLEPNPYIIADWQGTTTMVAGFIPVLGLQVQQDLV